MNYREFYKPIEEIFYEFNKNITFEIFLDMISITPAQVNQVQVDTQTQSESNKWYKYRKWRITASIFKEVVDKISENKTVKDIDKCKTIIAKICGVPQQFSSMKLQLSRVRHFP